MKQQSGFTLIELIAVIVILGIIAAVAVPRFVDLTGAAEEASVEGVAGALSSASALNYAAYVAQEAGVESGDDSALVDGCEDVAALLQGDDVPSGYVITPSESAIAAGDTENCTVGFDDGDGAVDGSKPEAIFTAYGTTDTSA